MMEESSSENIDFSSQSGEKIENEFDKNLVDQVNAGS